MCDNPATSDEHAPPKCLFPEQKDLPQGMDMSKHLITVPACDEHNSRKSKNDEYLLNILVINLPANEVAKNQFFNKIMRSIKRNPSLIKHITKNPRQITVADEATWKTYPTVALDIDILRLESVLDHI